MSNNSQIEENNSVLVNCLEMEWADRREVRSQSWRTVDTSLKILLGLLAAEFLFKDSEARLLHPVLLFGFVLLVLWSILGAFICHYHAKREKKILNIITGLESRIVLNKINATDSSGNTAQETMLDLIHEYDLSAPEHPGEDADGQQRQANSGWFKVSNMIIAYHLIIIGIVFVLSLFAHS